MSSQGRALRGLQHILAAEPEHAPPEGIPLLVRARRAAAVCALTLAPVGCAGYRDPGVTSRSPVTVHEDVVYESPYTTLTRVRDSEGNTIRYEKRSNK